MTPTISIQPEEFDLAAEAARLAGSAAMASFTGHVRGDRGVAALELEHYPAMTEAAVRGIAEEAVRRWPLTKLTVIHRVGRLEAGAQIVFVGAAADHRAAAIAAMHYVIDRLKTDAPFWKREHLEDGTSRWVEARARDEAARDRWSETE